MFLKGKFLVASPHLHESNFFRTVALIVRHNAEEAFGLVLNRPTTQNVQCVIEMVSSIQCVHKDPIFQGGPVEGPLLAIHNDPLQSGETIDDGIFMSTCQDQILDLVANPNIRLRVFDGYSGWGPSQLDEEIEQGGWLVLDASPDEIFGCPESIWESLVFRYGRQLIAASIGTDRIPRDPTCN